MFDILSKIHGIITNIKFNIIHPFKSDLHLYLINQFDEVLLEIKDRGGTRAPKTANLLGH